QKQTESEPVSENDVTFEDPPKNTARIPDELLDDVFTNVRIEDVGVKYSDDEDDADVPQAKGTSFEDIDTAVKTVKASKATDKEKRHAGRSSTRWMVTNSMRNSWRTARSARKTFMNLSPSTCKLTR
ncbi:TraD, partial [human gut metagenome]